MRHMKTVEVPAHTKQQLDRITCDLCGAEIKRGPYDVDDVVISREHGSRYPDGSFGHKDEIDMCGGCFEAKLIPWLRSQGCQPPRRTELDEEEWGNE